MTDKERRDRVRVDTLRPIEFIVKEHCYLGSIRNLSGVGAFVDTPQSFPVGEDISMIYSFEYEEENRTGQVVRYTSQGIGVKFKIPGYYGHNEWPLNTD